jgi:hypothetical protein
MSEDQEAHGTISRQDATAMPGPPCQREGKQKVNSKEEKDIEMEF